MYLKKLLVLHDFFKFFINYNQFLPELLLLWLREYKIIHQISLLWFIYNGKKISYKDAEEYENINLHINCKCRQFYERLHIQEIIKLEKIGKCIPKDFNFVEKINEIPIINIEQKMYFFENININLKNIVSEKINNTLYDDDDASITEDTSIFTNGQLTIYGLKLLFQSNKFSLEQILPYLDCIELCCLNILSSKRLNKIKVSSLQLLVPEYLRHLGCNILMEKIFNDECVMIDNIYNFINNRLQITGIPLATISIRESKITLIDVDDIGNFNSDNCICQLNYVGSKIYINVLLGKIYIFDDFGRKISLQLDAKFHESMTFFIQAIRITKGKVFKSGYAKQDEYVYIVTDIFIWHDKNVLNTSFDFRSKLIEKFTKTINCKILLPSALYKPSDFNDIKQLFYEELEICRLDKIHFNGIVYKNIITNKEYKYKFKTSKYSIVSENKIDTIICGVMDTTIPSEIVNGITIPDTEPVYSAYFLIKKIKNFIILYIYHRYRLQKYLKISTLPDFELKSTYRMKKKNKFQRFAMAKIGFNRFTENDTIDDIQYVHDTPSKNILNIVTLDQLIEYSKQLQPKRLEL